MSEQDKVQEYINLLVQQFLNFQKGLAPVPAVPKDRQSVGLYNLAMIKAATLYVDEGLGRDADKYRGHFETYYGAPELGGFAERRLDNRGGTTSAVTGQELPDGQIRGKRLFSKGDNYFVVPSEYDDIVDGQAYAAAVARVQAAWTNERKAEASARAVNVQAAREELFKDGDYTAPRYANGFEFEGYNRFPTKQLAIGMGNMSETRVLPEGFTPPGVTTYDKDRSPESVAQQEFFGEIGVPLVTLVKGEDLASAQERVGNILSSYARFTELSQQQRKTIMSELKDEYDVALMNANDKNKTPEEKNKLEQQAVDLKRAATILHRADEIAAMKKSGVEGWVPVIGDRKAVAAYMDNVFSTEPMNAPAPQPQAPQPTPEAAVKLVHEDDIMRQPKAEIAGTASSIASNRWKRLDPDLSGKSEPEKKREPEYDGKPLASDMASDKQNFDIKGNNATWTQSRALLDEDAPHYVEPGDPQSQPLGPISFEEWERVNGVGSDAAPTNKSGVQIPLAQKDKAQKKSVSLSLDPNAQNNLIPDWVVGGANKTQPAPDASTKKEKRPSKASQPHEMIGLSSAPEWMNDLEAAERTQGAKDHAANAHAPRTKKMHEKKAKVAEPVEPASATETIFTKNENTVRRAHDELFGIGKRDAGYAVMKGEHDYSSPDRQTIVLVDNGSKAYRHKVEVVVSQYEKRFLQHPEQRAAIYADLLKKYDNADNKKTNGGEYRDAMGLFARAEAIEQSQKAEQLSLPRFEDYTDFKRRMIGPTIAQTASAVYAHGADKSSPENQHYKPAKVAFDKKHGKIVHAKKDEEIQSVLMRPECREEVAFAQEAAGGILDGHAAALVLANITLRKNGLPTLEQKLERIKHKKMYEYELDKVGKDIDLVLPTKDEIKMAIAAQKVQEQIAHVKQHYNDVAAGIREENRINAQIKVPDDCAVTVSVNPGDTLADIIQKAPEAIAATRKVLKESICIDTPEQAALVLQIAVAAEYKLKTANGEQTLGNLNEVQIPGEDRIKKYVQSMTAAKGILIDGFIHDHEMHDKDPVALAQPLLKHPHGNRSGGSSLA